MKKALFLFLLTFVSISIFAQKEISYKEEQIYKEWVKLVPTLKDDFYKTKEAIRIAENVLLYQQTTGGWPKNIYIPAELNKTKRQALLAQKNNVNESTIDNSATTTEIYYLARIYEATKDKRYQKAVLDGLQYLFNAQYPNGGWPQFWPRPEGYYTEITYNDNAMVNVMKLLQEVYEKQEPYDFVPEPYGEKAHTAFDKGIECILKSQVKQNGKLTVWCAQHDRVTLQPIKARAYELPSLSGQESDNIVLLLMSLPNPSPEIINAVENAIEWFKNAKIEGIEKEYFTNENGKKDYKMIACSDCPPLWARFYDLDTNQPFFCDRNGIKVYSISEIGYERRNGYSWYNDNGLKVLKEYEKWKKKNNR